MQKKSWNLCAFLHDLQQLVFLAESATNYGLFCQCVKQDVIVNCLNFGKECLIGWKWLEAALYIDCKFRCSVKWFKFNDNYSGNVFELKKMYKISRNAKILQLKCSFNPGLLHLYVTCIYLSHFYKSDENKYSVIILTTCD